MTVALFRKGGEMFLDASGAPLAGGQLFYYQAGTTTAGQTWQDINGTVLNPQPIILDASGRLDAPVYFGTAYNYKELLTDVNGATIAPWPFDNLPAATAAAQTQTGFERIFLPWTSVTSASSPITLTQANAGNAYECDCSSGTINFNLPAAATANLQGTGYFWKRVDGVVANSLTITPNGGDNIDGVNAPINIGPGYQGLYLVSDGAQWLAFSFYNAQAANVLSRQAVTASGASLSIDMSKGWFVDLTLSANVTSVAVTHWPASGFLAKLTFRIQSTGAFTMSGWPGTTKWPGGIAPVITSSGLDWVMLASSDGGTNFQGFVLGQAFA